MDTSYLSLLIFIAITLLYYLVFKPKLNASAFDDKSGQEYAAYSSKNNVFLTCYFLLVVVTQIIMNSSVLVNTCGGSVVQNIGAAFLLTIIPWFFIFGILIGVLIIVTGFKCAFSDVIGYFFVAGETHALFKEMLINVDVEDEVNKLSEISNETKADVVKTIVDIFGNSSILINTIVPENFVDKWEMLTPIMKPNVAKSQDFQKKLWNLVYKRDSVGEAMWYIYTGVLLCCIIQFNIATVGCSNSPQAQTANYNEFLQKEKIIEAQRAKANTVHTMG